MTPEVAAALKILSRLNGDPALGIVHFRKAGGGTILGVRGVQEFKAEMKKALLGHQ